jgi:hypothetical protein
LVELSMSPEATLSSSRCQSTRPWTPAAMMTADFERCLLIYYIWSQRELGQVWWGWTVLHHGRLTGNRLRQISRVLLLAHLYSVILRRQKEVSWINHLHSPLHHAFLCPPFSSHKSRYQSIKIHSLTYQKSSK